jgi:hypothetical protein
VEGSGRGEEDGEKSKRESKLKRRDGNGRKKKRGKKKGERGVVEESGREGMKRSGMCGM